MRLAAERLAGLDSPQDGASSDRSAHDATQQLLDVMAALRHPQSGCPWDIEQSFATIAPYTVEEGYEVADAIARSDLPALPGELGDLLFQVVYHSQLAAERGLFTFADVAQAITAKMVQRHPHVFGTDQVSSAAEQTEAWEHRKTAERRARAEIGTLAGVPTNLPALTRAAKLTSRAARVGFDWPDAEAVLRKLDEEVEELQAELPAARPDRLADEVGDLLFVVANLARKLNLDPEACLRQANAKFARRFGFIEQALAAQGVTPAEATLEQMEAFWVQAKQDERAAAPDSET